MSYTLVDEMLCFSSSDFFLASRATLSREMLMQVQVKNMREISGCREAEIVAAALVNEIQIFLQNWLFHFQATFFIERANTSSHSRASSLSIGIFFN